MIVLDTHIWIWWVTDVNRLTDEYSAILKENEDQGLGVSIISCLEVARLVEKKRVGFPLPVAQWIDQALEYPGVQLLNLTPRIAVESTQLPGTFHRDPADQIIVATARYLDCALATVDGRIRNYPYVKIVS